MSTPTTRISVTLSQLAKTIDHSLLHPAMTDATIQEGLDISRKYGVATACIKPYSVTQAKQFLQGSNVGICAVIGFPAGNSTTAVKVFEATEAMQAGAHEVDMVVNIGKVLGGRWDYARDEIRAVNEAVVQAGGLLKVIFENDFLKDQQIVKLCEVCSDLDVAFVKTSTGYGFVKQPSGQYTYTGATSSHLKLMRQHSKSSVQVKAAGGVRTLDDLLYVMSLGVTRIGATATVEILEEARRRGIGEEPVEVEVKERLVGGGY